MPKRKKRRIGIIGTGFVARGLGYALRRDESLEVATVLTRRGLSEISDFPVNKAKITNSLSNFKKNCELVVECSGDAVYATEAISDVLDLGIPVVTMNSELHVTTGSWLAKKGFITEAEGDQPGSLAALYKDAVGMGFKPVVLGNIKGFLDHNPTKETMQYWAKRSGISLTQVTSFTDGTKLQIEQAFVANGFGFEIAKRGLLGIQCDDYKEGAETLAKKGEKIGRKISDYVLSSKSPAGVFIVATHDKEESSYLRYYKMGEGPYYTLIRPFHLCHLEITKTIKQVLNGEGVLLNNGSNPRISVATISKRKLTPGYLLKRGIGSFDVRGEAVNIPDYPNHVPIGLMSDVVIKRDIKPNQMITFDDLEIPSSKALSAWKEITKRK